MFGVPGAKELPQVSQNGAIPLSDLDIDTSQGVMDGQLSQTLQIGWRGRVWMADMMMDGEGEGCVGGHHARAACSNTKSAAAASSS